MKNKNLTIWTKVWMIIILFFIIYPLIWFIIERINNSSYGYETPITFIFFSILILLSLVIWGIGIWIKNIKK
ncbi:MAG: hypothetical protein AB7V77_00195 [Candidatus Woesearchaeota archaeon]